MRLLVKIVNILRLVFRRTPHVKRQAAKLDGADALRYYARQMQTGCAGLCQALGVDVRTEGPVPDRSGMLVVSNHFGILDPCIVASVIPTLAAGRADLLTWPLVGWVCAAHGMIPVDRERRRRAVEFVRKVRECLAAGVNMLVFPEGSSIAERMVRPFKTSAFEAVAGIPGAAVQPVYLATDRIGGKEAVEEVWRRIVWLEEDFFSHALRVAAIESMAFTVHFGLPIPAEGRDRKELAQLARQAVEDLRLRCGRP